MLSWPRFNRIVRKEARHRWFGIPKGVVLHHETVPDEDRTWLGPVPLTTPGRTILDCARASVSPDLLRQAARQAVRRGLVVKRELRWVEKILAPLVILHNEREGSPRKLLGLNKRAR